VTTSRTALITGANRGIGLEVARQLAEAGIAVVVASRDLDAGEVAARGLGPEARAEQLDVSDPDSVAACERRLSDAGVEIDILVNNAGLYTTTPLLAVDERALVEALQVNFIGAWRTARAFVPGMRARRWGRVVNVSTGYAHFAERPPQAGAYGLAKTSLNVLTRMIAAEAGGNVKVNSMSPGWVATRMGGAGAPRSAREGADTAVWLATLPDDGPTDGFYYDRQRIPW
jgi:NAD(P)-dependent dehydrogenase (short-subunit alcohol dehydrogenase family)